MRKYNNIGIIFQKEFRSYFNSPVAYILIVAFLAIIGWFFVNNIFLINLASLRSMFETIPYIYLLLIPALTMRLLADEQKSGTFELLATKPVHEIEIILGKFLAAWTLVLCTLVPTFLYFITIASLGKVDFGEIIGGYIGLGLMSAVFVAVGLFSSAITNNQIVAFIIGFGLNFALYMFDKILEYLPISALSVFEYIGIDYHYASISRGVIDTRDLIYFASVLIIIIYLTKLSLDRRKW
ncbi:MAG: ABC transporter permease subunit [Candidatus Kapabacteria bacterium]|nr:ABC transporter permease subunit [Candidatus Kapabacteria bacterium]